jgi:GTP-binding protein HflX
VPSGTVSVSNEPERERAFLVGLDVRTRGRGKKGVSGQAAAARDAADLSSASASAFSSSSADPEQDRQKGRRDSPSDGAKAKGKPTIPEFDAEESLAELRTLAESAGAKVVGEILQRRDRPDPATLVGGGKLEELAGAAASVNADVVLFDHDLSPSQQRNIEKIIQRRVIDRTQLILDIFARHARTREGQLQVELAQLQYMMPRLAGHGIEMSQLGGGIGTRGPGETKLETDRRKIARRVRNVEQQIENVRRIRTQQRQRRESAPVATVALVGYTNAGKSTLLNQLTDADALAGNRLFVTLDPRTRQFALPGGETVLVTDTVGFVRKLPHQLVEAFRSTLDSVRLADLLIHVVDGTAAHVETQMAAVRTVLREIGAGDVPQLIVVNKADRAPQAAKELAHRLDGSVLLSAQTGEGIDDFLRVVADRLRGSDRVVELVVPWARGDILAAVHREGEVVGQTDGEDSATLQVVLDEVGKARFAEFVATS